MVEEVEEEVKPAKKEVKKEVAEEPEDKREHINIIFIGHVGMNFKRTYFIFHVKDVLPNPVPLISMYLLLAVVYAFPQVLTGRICLTIKLVIISFIPITVIQGFH